MSIRFGKLKNKSTNDRQYNLKRCTVYSLLKLLWHISPAMAVGLVKTHVFKPAGYNPHPDEIQTLETGTRFQLDLHGKTVQGWTWGQGPGVLFVHGWNGRGIQLHHFIKPLTQAGLAVITFDAPGHGDSEGKTGSYFQFTDAIRAMLNPQNGFNIKGVVGYSLGGAAVINALSKENSSIPAVLIAPALRLKKILLDAFDLYGIPEEVHREAIAAYEQRFGYTMDKDDPHKLLPAINSDLLIVHDRHDREIPFKDSKEMAEKWPRVGLYETEGLGHRRLLLHRETVAVTSDYMITHIDAVKPLPLETRPDLSTYIPAEKIAAIAAIG